MNHVESELVSAMSYAIMYGKTDKLIELLKLLSINYESEYEDFPVSINVTELMIDTICELRDFLVVEEGNLSREEFEKKVWRMRMEIYSRVLSLKLFTYSLPLLRKFILYFTGINDIASQFYILQAIKHNGLRIINFETGEFVTSQEALDHVIKEWGPVILLPKAMKIFSNVTSYTS